MFESSEIEMALHDSHTKPPSPLSLHPSHSLSSAHPVQLVVDLTVVLVAAAVLGSVCEVMGQPTINGYLIAGAMVGPGGLNIVKVRE